MEMVMAFNGPKQNNWFRDVELTCLEESLKLFIDEETEKFHLELKNECGADPCVKNCDFESWKPRPNEVYMPCGHKDHSSVGDFDIASLLCLMTQCKHFKEFKLGDLCEKIQSRLADLPENMAADIEALKAQHEKELNDKMRNQEDYYALTHKPRGLCVVINNEEFLGTRLKRRKGTQEDAMALRKVFTQLGFTMEIHENLTAEDIRHELQELGKRDFSDDDALVVCVLSHGEQGTVGGTDEEEVSLGELTQPFTSLAAPSLAGKPKLFFIQACQGSDYQRGAMLGPESQSGGSLEDDSISSEQREMVPCDADFLLGMATVPDFKSFRHTTTGSIYIQELCKQLIRSAESSEMDDILTVLTRVNRQVGKGDYGNHKQMPESKYTLTKKLVLKFV
ncbi:caspase-8-like [Centropristis striata]|uniref:caspase-8-like n=1 Tax=Centropristis striata TaxID=184440 RepID=UPI0027E19E3F|nr:caspase-8-like [Centropristis striata]